MICWWYWNELPSHGNVGTFCSQISWGRPEGCSWAGCWVVNWDHWCKNLLGVPCLKWWLETPWEVSLATKWFETTCLKVLCKSQVYEDDSEWWTRATGTDWKARGSSSATTDSRGQDRESYKLGLFELASLETKITCCVLHCKTKAERAHSFSSSLRKTGGDNLNQY